MKMLHCKLFIYFGLIFLIVLNGYGDDIQLFENIMPGSKWGDLKDNVKYEPKKFDGETLVLPNDGYAHGSRILLMIDVLFKDNIKLGMVFDQNFEEPLSDNSELLFVYTRDKKFKFKGENIIGNSVEYIIKVFRDLKVSFKDLLFREINNPNGIRFILEPCKPLKKCVFMSDKIKMVGQIKKGEIYGECLKAYLINSKRKNGI